MLLKNVLQTFRKKWPQLLAVGLIIYFSSFIYSSMFYAISGLEKPTLRYLDEYVQEDFSFEMISVLTSEEIAWLRNEHNLPEEIYSLADLAESQPVILNLILQERKKILSDLFSGINLETRQFKDFYFNANGEEHRALIIKDSDRINLSYIETGHFPQDSRQIALTRVYAEKNGLNIGDAISLQGITYEISGFVLFPDYTYAVLDQSFVIDNEKLTLFLANDAVYDIVRGQTGFRLAGIFREQPNREEYKQAIMDIPADSTAASFVLGATLTENQFRSGAIFTELMSAKVFGLGFGLLIAMLAVFIVAMILSRILHAQQRQIGVLKALGYRRRKIALPYLAFISATAFPMLIVGYFTGFLAGEPLKGLMLDFYLIPSTAIEHIPETFLTATLLPLTAFTAFSAVIIFRLLAKEPLELLHQQKRNKVNRLTRLASRILHKRPGKTKFKYLYALQNTGKFYIFVLGIIMAAVLILIGLMMNGLVDRMTIDVYERVNYRYEAYLDITEETVEVRDDQEKFLHYANAFYSDMSITAFGLEWDNQLYRLFDSDQQDITEKIRNDTVVSKSLSLKTGLDEGDSIEIMIGNRSYNLTIAGVAADYTADKIFLNIEDLSLMISDGASASLYSGIYAIERPDDEHFSTVLSKQSIIEQAKILQEFFQYVVYTMLASAVIIALLILFLLTSLTIEDNYYNISLLQVIGYRKKEVNAMVLNSYLVYSLFAFLISLPLAFFLSSALVDFFAQDYNTILPLEFHWFHLPIALFIILSIFLAGTWHGRRKIANISLQEILNIYDE